MPTPTKRTTPKKRSEATAAADWKRSGSSSTGATLLPLPSGNTALVRRPGMEAFLKAGMIPNSLMSVITEVLDKAAKPGVPKRAQDKALEGMKDELVDPQKLADMFTLVDEVILFCMVEPNVLPVPPLDGSQKRDPAQLYVDEMDMSDKFYVFNYAVGGAANLERFRP